MSGRFQLLDTEQRANEQRTKSLLASNASVSISDWIAHVKKLPLRSVYFSMEELRSDLAQLNLVIENFSFCHQSMANYRNSFTASAFTSLFRLNENLKDGHEVHRKVLTSFAEELHKIYGDCPESVLASWQQDYMDLTTHEIHGVPGKKWAMAQTAPDAFAADADEATAVAVKEGDAELKTYLIRQLRALMTKYQDTTAVVWFWEGLRKSVNRGSYGFLNFQSFVQSVSAIEGDLAWTKLGWVVNKWGERDLVIPELFGSGADEKQMHDVAASMMPSFISQLIALRSALQAQITRAEELQAKFLAVFVSACIASMSTLFNLAESWYIHRSQD